MTGLKTPIVKIIQANRVVCLTDLPIGGIGIGFEGFDKLDDGIFQIFISGQFLFTGKA